MNKKHIYFFCLFGFVIRVIYILIFNPDIKFPDEERFWEEASSLVNNFTLQASGKYAHDMPLTALYVAIVSVLSGGSVIIVKISFAFVSAITIYFIASLAHGIYPARYTSIISAGIASVYPYFIYYSSLILSETLFLFLVVLLFWQVFSKKNVSYFRVGIIAGLSHLTRPTLIYFFPVMIAWGFIVKKISINNILIMIFSFLCIISLWGGRNVLVLNQFHISTSGSGHALWEGNNPWNTAGGTSGDFSEPKAYLSGLPKGLDELEADLWKKEEAKKFILGDINHFLDLSIMKFFRFWSLWPNSNDYQNLKYKLMSIFSFGLVLLLAIFFVFSFRKDFKSLSLFYVFILYYTLIHMITIGSIRYRLPLEPILIVMASAFLSKKLNNFTRINNARK